MNLHLPCKNSPGYNRILQFGDLGMNLTGFGLLHLKTGEKYAISTGSSEQALVILGGTCAVRGTDFEFATVGERKDVFSGRPHTVYLPADINGEIEALSDVEIAVAESPATQPGQPALIKPEQTRSFFLGRDNFRREAVIMIDEKFPAEHLFIGEAYVPSGNWGSFPPHRHDFDNLPLEVNMEEIYFFRFNPAGGFGIQKIYTDNRDIDVVYTVKENDTVAIPQGYHPVVNAPGYTMYYLWIMAGKNRGFINVKDPAYAWIA